MLDDLTELPEGWEWVELGDVTSHSTKKFEPFEAKIVPYIGLEHIEKDTGNLSNVGVSSEVTSTKSKFSSGDLLYGKLRPYLNKVHCVNFDGICSTDILVFPKNDCVENEFLKYRFLSQDFVNYASQNVNGVQHPRVNVQTLSEFELALPPLNEQKRIVAKIEELRSHTQAARNAIAHIPKLLEQFRQSVLAAAFRGDLTAEWRSENPDVEPAEILLQRIRKERRDRWELAELEKMRSAGKMPKDDKWKSKYKEPDTIDDSELLELPEYWCWASVETFADVGTGATPLRGENKYYEYGDIPWITSGALNDLLITSAEEFITYLAVKETNAKPFPKHTLLIAMYGEGKTRGKVSELLIEAATNQACAAVILEGISSQIRPIVKLFFQKNYSDIRLLASGGVQPNLNLSMIKATIVPLPPIKEQIEIIRLVIQSMEAIDRIEQQYQFTKTELDRLDRSILAKAFKGELVPQDPTDEPAIVLLERIRNDRASQVKPAKTKRKKA